jgi:hypothetical protein
MYHQEEQRLWCGTKRVADMQVQSERLMHELNQPQSPESIKVEHALGQSGIIYLLMRHRFHTACRRSTSYADT